MSEGVMSGFVGVLVDLETVLGRLGWAWDRGVGVVVAGLGRG